VFLGLLGTVLGIMKSFADLSLTTSKGGAQVVMAGVSDALLTTVFGIIVAVPAIIFFNICKTKVKNSTDIVESMVSLIESKGILG